MDTELTLPNITAPFGAVSDVDRFSTRNHSYRVGTVDFSRIERNAREIARSYVDRVDAPECEPLPQSAACHRAVLEGAVSALYRRPATEDDIAALMELEPPGGGSTEQERLLMRVRAVLMSPEFLFRPELGDPESAAPLRPLGAFELASALSFTITAEPPDAMLYAAALDGDLLEPEVYRAHVDRLLDSPRHHRRVARFLREYWGYDAALNVAKDQRPIHVFPEGTEGAEDARYRPRDLVEQTDALIDALASSARRRDFIGTMLTTADGFVNERTAIFYNAESSAEESEPTTFPPDERRGILMQPAWLVAHSEPDHNSPIRRGLFIQESMLCGEVPDLPIEGVPPLEVSPDEPLRETLAIHLEAGERCVGCHTLMDPLGFPFEQFDHFGRHRTQEAGQPVDASGVLAWSRGEFDQAGPVPDVHALVDALAASDHVAECVLQHAFQFWLGRDVGDEDLPTIRAAADAYRESGGDFDAALRELFASTYFRHRVTP